MLSLQFIEIFNSNLGSNLLKVQIFFFNFFIFGTKFLILAFALNNACMT